MSGREIPCAYREVPLRKCHPFSMTMVNYQRVYSGSAPCTSHHLISRVNMGPNIQSMTNRADEPCSQWHAGTGLVLLTSQGSKHGILEVHSSTGIIPVAILGTCWVHLIQPYEGDCEIIPKYCLEKDCLKPPTCDIWCFNLAPPSLDPRYHPPNQQFDPEQFANV